MRKQAFADPPTRRNRLWQADFSEFETNGAGTWNLGGVVDYWAKASLACEVSLTKTTADAIRFLDCALAEAENLLGITWVADLADPDTGEIGTLKLVTDNGPCFKSARFAAWVASKRHITHIRTRNRAPQTNGVIERFFEAVKYEHLYRRDIADGIGLAAQARSYRTIYNQIRPHEAIDMARPLDRYRHPPPPTKPPDQKPVSNP